jgi:molybdopterin-synthase adenylyltransferase
MLRSAAVSTQTGEVLDGRLLRADGQEDLCFALWHPSQGRDRETAVVSDPILPRPGERHLHGNASFETDYFLRAVEVARDAGAGLALLHSHPGGRGWQGMSVPDTQTESRFAPRAFAGTGRPLVGLTMAGCGALSARFWERTGRRSYERVDCENVRRCGGPLRVTWNDGLAPPPPVAETQIRTVTAWGPDVQADLARLRIGVVGVGSVGAIIAETLARTGVQRLRLMDFDSVEMLNLDRLLHATPLDVRLARSKVEVARRGILRGATGLDATVEALDVSVVEETGFRAALDCDVLFSCVDRPWPRAALNYIALAHLIPVVDVGIGIRRMPNGRMRSARWRAHVVAPGRRCLECIGQFDSGQVPLERDESLDDPRYIEQLPHDHPLRARQNVFAFSQAAAALAEEQFLRMLVAPGGLADVGGQLHEFKPGTTTLEPGGCEPSCAYAGIVASGESSFRAFAPTGEHHAAMAAREARRRERRRASICVRRRATDLLDAVRARL